MPVPNLNLAPFENIGNTLAGGGALRAQYAEAQGESLGANTQRAIAEANAQFAKNQALNDPALESKLAAVNGGSQQLGAALGGLLRAGVNPEQTFSAIGENQRTGFRGAIADTSQSDAARASALLAADPQSHGVINPTAGGEAATNALHPELGVTTTPFGEALLPARIGQIKAQTNLANAGANLKGAEASNPAAFHPSAYGSVSATPQDITSYAGMVRRGEAPPPTGTGLARLGGAHFMSIVGSMDDNGQPTSDTKLLMGTPAPGAPGAEAAPTSAMPSHGFNAANYQNAAAFDKSVNSIQPNQFGGRLRAGNTLTAHLGTLKQLADAADGNDLPTVQRVTMALTGQAGSDIPTSLKLASHFVGGELDNFLAAGNSTLEGRKDAQAQFDANDIGAAQLRGNVGLGRNLMGGQFASMKKTYVNAPGARMPFEGRMLDPTVVSDWEKEHGPVTRGSAVPSPGTAPPVATPGPSAAPPVATPGPSAALPPFNPQQPVPGVDFADEATAQQAAAKGIIKSGQKIRINGQTGTWH